MQAARLATRLQRELRMLQSDPPPGVCAWPCDDSLSHLQAQIQGPDGTVYAKGLFKLEIRVPDRYPFEPPSVRFKTPIYHPNIDSGGRICLDILNMPPKGAWKPSLNIPTVLASIGLLLAEPNPDDGLMGDITAEYKHNRLSFDMTATKWTHQYAMQEESATGENCARNPASDDVQQSPSVNVESSAPEALTELGCHDKRQHELSVCLKKVQTSTVVGTTASNKLGKSSVVSNSKLILGTKLSLEKGIRESEKQGKNVGSVGISAVTYKRALECIENTVGVRQGAVQESQPLKKTSVESTIVKGKGKDTDMSSEHNENSRVADGSQALGVSTIYTHKIKSTGASIDLGKLKRPRGGSASPPTDSSPKLPKQQTCYPDKDKLSVPATTSSVVATVAECPERSKYFVFSPKASRNSSTEGLEIREKAHNLVQDGPKSLTCVASRPVRIPLRDKPVDRALENDQVRSCDQACASTVQKAFVEMSEGKHTPPLTSSYLLKSSTGGVVAFTKKDNSEEIWGHGPARNEAGQFDHGQSSSQRSNLESSQRIDQHATAASVVRCTSLQLEKNHDTLVANSLLDRSRAHSTSSGSRIAQSRAEPSKCFRATDVDIVIHPDEPVIAKKATGVSVAVRRQMAKKPPIPAKPATDVIVLDSESEDEPPKGRSRLSLSRRGVKKKTKD